MKFVCVTEGYDPSRVNAASATAAAETYASRHDTLAGEGASERTVFVRADASDEIRAFYVTAQTTVVYTADFLDEEPTEATRTALLATRR